MTGKQTSDWYFLFSHISFEISAMFINTDTYYIDNNTGNKHKSKHNKHEYQNCIKNHT